MKNSFKRLVSCIMLIFVSVIFIPTNVFAATNLEEDCIIKEEKLPNLNKNYPIVMVHGLFGWGNDELFGLNYWGGKSSLREMLNSEGYTVYTPTIGPIASNWDRACELYAYLKGGTVDYGEAHAQKCGHNRYGRTYQGVYPELGNNNENGELQKVHLIGHSMGGQTIRVLAQLLEDGSQEEIACTGENTNKLFVGNNHFIESITTLATPHDGSQQDDVKMDLEPRIHQFFAVMATKAGRDESENPKFDLKLDQWGLKRNPGESYESYYKRVFTSKIWGETKDLSIWDLSLEGAKELNSWVKTHNDIYYFSIACVDTHKDLKTDYQVPNINMNPLLLKSSKFMGSYINNEEGKVIVDNSWWRNDGIVSVRSAIAPHEGSTDNIVEYNGQEIQKGIWNYLGEINNIDHIEVVGQHEPIYKKYLQNKFRNWAKMLCGEVK